MILVEGDGSDASPAEMQRKLVDYQAWMNKYKATSQYISGNPFATEGAYLPNGSEVRTTGDFLNPETTVGGYMHIKAEDQDGAVAIAKECPLLRSCGLYVRPFLSM